jgi:hypothetical protein
MIYPEKILPQANRIKINTISVGDFYLIRHTKEKNLLSSDGMLSIKAVSIGAEKILPDYSSSLFGIFKSEEGKIKIINDKYLGYCKPDENVTAPAPGVDYVLESERNFWYVRIDDIHNTLIKYNDGFEAVCEVIHTPMLWNFWHFSVRWFITEHNCYWYEKKDMDTKKIRRKLIFEIRSLLRNKAVTQCCDYNLSDDVYQSL